MKKCILALFLGSTLVWCYASDLTLYQNVRFVDVLDIKQPKIVEISGLKETGDYVITDDKNEVVPQQFQVIRKSKVIPPQSVVSSGDWRTQAVVVREGVAGAVVLAPSDIVARVHFAVAVKVARQACS